jgi:hypothetical protein
MYLFLLLYVLMEGGGDMKEKAGNSMLFGFMYGGLTFGIMWFTNLAGWHGAFNLEFAGFYVLAAVLVVFVFSACGAIKKMVKVTQDAAEQIASQQ